MGKSPLKSSDVYLRFLQLAESIRGLPGLPGLDPLEERILMVIAAMSRAGQTFSVRELMRQHELGAPATIHSRLKSMRTKGWVQLVDEDHGQRKRVELTRDAHRHFERLSRAMIAAASDGGA